MPFYTDLCDVYDALFPVTDAQRSLFDDLSKSLPVRRVVDAGCGSGAQLLHFARKGIACAGFDPDPALSGLAGRKLAPYPDARVETGGFADLPRLVQEPVDLVLCLGNSIVHVPQDEAARFVADAASRLRPAGALLVQLLHYDRLLREGITELPVMRAEGGAIEFTRRYLWEGPRRVRFLTELRFPGRAGGRVVRNDIPLFPIYRDELVDMLSRAGFGAAECYGDFARSALAPDSDAIVCIARTQ